MSKLTDLRAALDAKLETEAEHPSTATSWHMDVAKADETLHALLTDDTIRALLDVAEAVAVADPCIFCNKDDESRHHPHCPLAPLVKEADHDRA